MKRALDVSSVAAPSNSTRTEARGSTGTPTAPKSTRTEARASTGTPDPDAAFAATDPYAAFAATFAATEGVVSPISTGTPTAPSKSTRTEARGSTGTPTAPRTEASSTPSARSTPREVWSAARIKPKWKWDRLPNSESKSSGTTLSVKDDQACIVLDGCHEADAPQNNVDQSNLPVTPQSFRIDQGMFDAHMVVLPYRRKLYRDIVEPYAVFCRSDLNPVHLASIFQRSDHEYFHNNAENLESNGHIVYKKWPRRGQTYTGPQNSFESFIESSFKKEVVRVRQIKCTPIPRQWAFLMAKYMSTTLEDHMNDLLYFSLRGEGLGLNTSVMCEKRISPKKMKSSWMSSDIVYDSIGLYSMATSSTEMSYAFNIPGLRFSPPVALLFFSEYERVVAIVVGRGLKPRQHVSLMRHQITVQDCRCIKVLSTSIIPPASDEDVGYSDEEDVGTSDDE